LLLQRAEWRECDEAQRAILRNLEVHEPDCGAVLSTDFDVEHPAIIVDGSYGSHRAGFDPEFGARPLRRTIQRRVDNELAGMVLSGSLNPGDRVVVGAEDRRLTFDAVEAVKTPGEDR
jgi:hypothetical protein